MTKKNTSDYLLSRRESLRLLGAAGATTLLGMGGEKLAGLWPSGRFGSVVQAGAKAGAVSVADVIRPALLVPSPRAVLYAPAPLAKAQSVEAVSCFARPALTEGPYFVDERPNRSDIRSDPTNNNVKAGTPLRLKFNVGQVTGIVDGLTYVPKALPSAEIVFDDLLLQWYTIEPNRTTRTNPEADTVLNEGATLILAGDRQTIARLKRLLVRDGRVE